MRETKHWLLCLLGAAFMSANLPACGQDFSSMQMQGVEQVTIDVDVQAAAERLSRAVQFPTISNQDRSDFDTEAFNGYHEFLVETYPNVHRTLKRELLGDPRSFSLLYTWEGTDPELAPVVFYAHQDVVPVPEDSREQTIGFFYKLMENLEDL